MTEEVGKDEYTVCDQCRARKIRCSREKPSCRNCDRLGLRCEWSGQGKKCNQTTLLSHTVLGMGSRLQQLESSLAETQSSLKRLFEQSSITLPDTPPSPRRPTNASRPAPELTLSTPQNLPAALKSMTFTRPPSRLPADLGDDERCFGPTSLESLMLSIKDELSESPDMNGTAMKDCIVQSQRKIDLLVGQGEPDFVGELSTPTVSSFAILDAMIAPYFATINHHFPIWTKDSFIRMANTLRQSPPSKRDLAAVICCNNLVLMAMSAESLASLKRESTQTKQTHKTSSIDFEIMEGFLTNAKRAVRNIDQLVKPRLINVQALLSLHVVAQEYLSIGISETLFALAARCAKSIGIHQWHSFQDQLGHDEMKQRQNISYYLYVLDKAHSWASGSCPSLPLSEIHFEPSALHSEDDALCSLAARVEMARIEETVFLEIYAVQAKAKNEEQVRSFTSTILSRLQGCLDSAGVDLERMQKSPDSSASNLQLAVRYFCLQLLLVWPYKDHPHPAFQEGSELAGLCLKLLLRLWHSPPDQGGHAAFPFFLATLPPLYLYQVLSSIISGQGSDVDMDTLQEFVELLETITHCRAEASYNRRLFQLSLIIIDVMNARKSQHKRQKLVPEAQASTSYLMSDLLSPPQSGYNYMNSEMQETLDDSVFQGAEDAFNTMSPITSRTGDMDCGTDELFSYLRNCVKTVPVSGNFNSSALKAFRESAS